MSEKSAEQQARDLLEQCGVEDAQSFTAGDVIALANFIADASRLRHALSAVLALHERSKGYVDDICQDCALEWPCPTMKALKTVSDLRVDVGEKTTP